MSRYYDYGNAISWNSQALSSGGPGSAQGKDPLAPAISGSRAMYQHPAVSGYNPQDSRSQSMPGSARQNSLYASSMYHYSASGATLAPMPSPSPTTTLPPFPVHPDVKFKKLPFYDVLAELMKPSTMMPMQAGRMQEGTFIFHLTPQQATEIASGKDIVGTSNKLDYVIQAQLRFCLLETSCEQEDYFPPSVNVKINNKMCPLPNPVPTNKPTPEPKRPPRPVNISSLVKLSPTVANTIHVTWAADFTRAYVLSVFMVRKLTSAELLQRLKNKGTKNPDYTRSLIKEKLSEDYDSEIATTSLRVSLMCPLGKMRMSCPCRPANCPHLQCFDASLFLQMNERKPTWLCPVCDRTAPYDSLVVDGYFQEVLTSPRLASECNEIQLHADGNWSAHAPPPRAPPPAAPAHNESVTLIADDLEVIPVDGNNAAKRAAVGDARTPKMAEVLVDLTSDSEDELPLKRKVPLPKSTPPVLETTIKTDDSYTTSSEAVSSSGYRSPGGGAVISLDSPSPPAPASPRELTRTHAHEHAHEHAAAHAIDALSPHSLSSDICTTNTIDREENESTPTHWAPYADTDRDTHDTYRRTAYNRNVEKQPDEPEDVKNDLPDEPENVDNELPDEPEDVENDLPDEPENVDNELPDEPEDDEKELPDEPEDFENELPDEPEDVENELPDEPEDVKNELPDEPENVDNELPGEPEDFENELPDEPEDVKNELCDEPEDDKNELPSMSEPMGAQDAVASTLATAFALPIIAASKSKAQKQREYRQRIAASRTPAQAAAARKLKTEKQRNNRLRQAAISSFAKPITAAPKTRAQIQREYRQRIAQSKTPAQAAAAREARNLRDRNNRLRQAAKLVIASGSPEATTTSSSHLGQTPSILILNDNLPTNNVKL